MRDGGGEPPSESSFRQAVETTYGSYEIWKEDFVGVGKMRGVGWAVCFQDPHTKQLSNHWITLHEVNNVAGYAPILVMDVWEHAFLLDYAPADRPKYIEAFFSNIKWEAVEQRIARPVQAGSQAIPHTQRSTA
jgi:Fe-Mn family superoxide dismutase